MLSSLSCGNYAFNRENYSWKETIHGSTVAVDKILKGKVWKNTKKTTMSFFANSIGIIQ